VIGAREEEDLMATIPPGVKDVAARAGVSVGTVSNVLNGRRSVREDIRLRVEQAIAELGFVRNESARQLRAGRSRTLAYVLLDTTNPFFTDVARGVEEVARQAGLALFLCNSDQDAAREDDYLELLLQQRVRGVLVTPVDTAGARLAALPARGVPVVLLDRAEHDGFSGCSVSVDDVEGGDLAATHLIELGHRRLAFVGGPTHLVQVRDRLRGARQAVAAAGLPEDALVVLETVSLTVAEWRRAGTVLTGLPARRRPTGVFCANDLLALGLLQQLAQLGVDVPGDVAIVGYDDIEFAAAATVPLTSVRQPRHLLGRTAAELLLEEDAALEARQPHSHRQVQFSPDLVVRESTRTRRAAARHGESG
jgi:LacI family transcriptional regulator